MLKQKLNKIKVFSKRAPLIGLAVTTIVGGASGIVRADQFDQQIQALNNKNAANYQSLSGLQVTASNYRDAINKLQTQIDAIAAQISKTKASQAIVKAKIVDATNQLNKQKKILGNAIQTMYLDGQTSTLEVLLSSDNLSSFVNQEQYHLTVESNIKALVDQITALKAKLNNQNDHLKVLITSQKRQESQVAASISQKNQLLSYNQSQQDGFNAKISNNNARIASLRAQQLAANQSLGGSVVAGDPGRGGYPNYLYNAAKDSLVDPWGMYNRECVSYAAWKVQQTYGVGAMPYWGGRGDANQWPSSATADGIPTGSKPRVHSVAISTSGYYGHAMWVEAVNGNMIYVSQMNFDLAGHYSEMWVNGSGFTYIYFR